MRKFLLFILVITLFSCNKENSLESHIYQGEALGTTYMIRYFSDKDFNFEKSVDSIFESINTSMSTYRIGSDISRINRGDTTVIIDDNFKKVFEASGKIYKESGGFFDPTVGALVNAYGFGPEHKLNEIDDSTLDSLINFVGFNKIKISDKNTVEKENRFIYLDFNAIAKGYTIDVIARFLEFENVQNYLIELGGELRAKGKNLESENKWIVGIDDPMQEVGSRELKAKISLVNTAMATSGNYRKFRQDSVTGQKFVHTINPLTGKAQRSNLLSASVLAKNCMLADAYATAFMALGLDGSKKMLKKLDNVEVYLIYSAEDGSIKIYSTPKFKNQLID